MVKIYLKNGRPVHVPAACPDLPGGPTCGPGIGIHSRCCSCAGECSVGCIPPSFNANIAAFGCAIATPATFAVKCDDNCAGVPSGGGDGNLGDYCLVWEATVDITCGGNTYDLVLQLRWQHQDDEPGEIELKYRIDGVQAFQAASLDTANSWCTCLIFNSGYVDPLCTPCSFTVSIGSCGGSLCCCSFMQPGYPDQTDIKFDFEITGMIEASGELTTTGTGFPCTTWETQAGGVAITTNNCGTGGVYWNVGNKVNLQMSCNSLLGVDGRDVQLMFVTDGASCIVNVADNITAELDGCLDCDPFCANFVIPSGTMYVPGVCECNDPIFINITLQEPAPLMAMGAPRMKRGILRPRPRDLSPLPDELTEWLG